MTASSPSGRVLRDHRGERLEFARAYEEPISEVWTALTDPERTARWFGRWSGGPASGRVEVEMTAEEGAPSETMVIVACEAPRRLEVETGPEGAWRLAVALDESGGGTALRFAQPLGDADDPTAIGPGWHFYLDRLGAVIAGEPVPDDFAEYHPALKDAYTRGD